VRPGFGLATAAASSDVSSHVTIANRSAVGGCGMLTGGITPVRSLCDDLLPDFGLRVRFGYIDAVETQTRSLQAVVMARRTVPIDELTLARTD
jgi:hypothetical protein